jgi:hypothetical protein
MAMTLLCFNSNKNRKKAQIDPKETCNSNYDFEEKVKVTGVREGHSQDK